jgi:hypothetical protein
MTCVGQQLGRAARGEDLHTKARQGLGKFEDACLVGHADQRALNLDHGDCSSNDWMEILPGAAANIRLPRPGIY